MLDIKNKSHHIYVFDIKIVYRKLQSSIFSNIQNRLNQPICSTMEFSNKNFIEYFCILINFSTFLWKNDTFERNSFNSEDLFIFQSYQGEKHNFSFLLIRSIKLKRFIHQYVFYSHKSVQFCSICSVDCISIRIIWTFPLVFV